MENRLKVSDTVFVSRTPPSEDDLQRLATEGFASIIDLRELGEGTLSPPLEAAAAGRNGLRYAHIPVPTDRIAPEMLDRFASALATMPGPVLVHCASGKRSGTFALVAAAVQSGATGRAALANIEAAGALYGSETMQAAIRRYVDRKSGRAWLRAAAASHAAGSGARSRGALRAARITSDVIDRRIARDIDASIRWHALHRDEIGRRLEELDREWDVERVITANAATLALGGVLLGAFVDRRWLVLPAAVAALLLQQTIQGRSPPVPVLRRLGVRMGAEIDRERAELQALRGNLTAARSEDSVARIRPANAGA
jgi:uncharacterized protein (TIGR01244 family)